MKVTVCFGSTKVVVPCGQGELLVSELIDKATTRYKKAIGKTPDYWVTVVSLKSSSDGGILDPDDQLQDVADDREQIVALYEEQEAPPIPHNGGDGTSASSVGTSSPDIFHGGEYNNNKEYHRYQRHNNKNDVVITQNDLNSTHNGSSLIVRRGSEPTLTKVVSDDSGSFHPDFYPQKPCIKRWSAIASIDEAKSPRAFEADDENESDTPPPTLERAGLVGQEEEQNSPNSSFSTFSRGSSRQSLANNAAMFKWLDAQDRAQDQYEHAARKEPLGGRSDEDTKHTSPPITPPGKQGQLVVLPNSSGPLGIHVVPEFDNAGRERGLLIQSVETEGRIHSDGRIKPRDVIIEINGITLGGINFSKAQEVFRQALLAKDLRMLVIKAPPPLPDQPPPKDRPLSPIVPTAPSLVTPEKRSSRERSISSDRKVASVTPTKLEIKLPERSGDDSSSGKTPPSSPTRGPPPPVPARNPTTSLTNTRFVATNTRKIGRKIHIQLTKGPQGLGFSVTTRDNPTGGHAPIYIKNILPKGAAIEDGNLKPGDRLLEVNGIEMTGKSQTEAVTVLRNTKMGGVVNLVVSRQVEETDEKSDSESGAVQKQDSFNDSTASKQTILLDIAMSGAESTGLGLNVKGKTVTSSDEVKDLGIYIKAIITGGAAAQDGRVKINDQLLEVNGDTLLGKTNPQAMEVLRHAVQKEGDKPGYISILLSRKIDNSRIPSVHEARISQSDNSTEIANHKQEQKPKGSIMMDKANPLLAKLKREQSLRNVSYQIANHDSLVNDTFQDPVPVDRRNTTKDYGIAISAKNVSNPAGSSILIQADSPRTIRMRSNSSSSGVRVRPASTLGFMTSEPDSRTRLSISKSNQDLLDGDTKWLKEWDKAGDVVQDEKSPVEDVDPSTAFQREGFGRQSMSEKRKGHINPNMSEFYQKIKSGKDSGSSQFISASWDPRRSAFQQIEGSQREKFAALKRVASAESLLSSNRLTVHENPPYPPEPQYSPRSHNKHRTQMSYRQQHENGYHNPLAHQHGLMSYLSQPCLFNADSEEVGPLLGLKKSSSMESLQRAVQEEEASEKNGKSHGKPGGRGVNESFRAAVDRSYEQTGEAMETVEEEGSEVGSVSQDGRSRAESLSQDGRSRASSVSGTDADKRSKKPKKDKEKEKGIFKGFFKLGKNKKPDSKAKSTEELRDSDKRADNVHKPIDNREWLHEQRQMAAEKQRVAEQKQREEQLGIEQQAFHQAPSPPHTGAGPGMSRADKIQQLRMEHQRRHRERQGQYPQDAEEERKIQELERQKQAARMNSESGYYGNVAIPPRQRLDESMKYERARPAFVDGEHYSHYQNIQEIQAQLRKHDYYQHRHHHQATPAGYTPSPYTREVNMPPPVAPPPSDPRYHHQRGYAVTPHSRDPHRGGTGSSSDLMHYGYYTPHHHHPAYRTTTPSPHPHAHTPANHSSANHSSAYMSHSALSKSTPQIIVNPPPQEYSRSRAYSEYDPEPRTIYRDPPYGSLPRRRDHREMPGSAQV